MFLELLLHVGVKRGNLTTSSVLYPDKTMPFPLWSVSRIWGEKKMEIKVAKINAPLN